MNIAECVNLKKSFPGKHSRVSAVDGVSLEIIKGETLGLVGESASGKTTLGKLILGVLKPDSGSANLFTPKPQIIFQDPYNSLDPRMKVFDIVAEGLNIASRRSLCLSLVPRLYCETNRQAIRKKVSEAIGLVRLPTGALQKYPHEFSGGERQRIAIARAIVTDPEFIVCDEPVSSLDVTIQLEILNLLKDIRARLGVTYLFISHDLRAVKYICGRVAVMKSGRIVEDGPADKIYSTPQNEYTKKLLSSILCVYPR